MQKNQHDNEVTKNEIQEGKVTECAAQDCQQDNVDKAQSSNESVQGQAGTGVVAKPKGGIGRRLAKRWFIDAFSGMAMGLFATLIAGTILAQIAQLVGDNYVGKLLNAVATVAKSAMGAGIGAGIAYSLKCDKLTIFSCIAAGLCGALIEIDISTYAFSLSTGVGNPIGAYICALAAAEISSLVSGKTKLDIVIVPLTCMLCAFVMALTLCPVATWLLAKLSYGIAVATLWSPFLMGIIIAVIMGNLLTLPTSSAAIWVVITSLIDKSVAANQEALLIAGGAALVGCCCHMVGFAVMSWRENGWSGLIAQGIGTSMLQIPNVMRNGKLLIPPTVASAILGPVATCLFKLKCGSGAGMGTSGLVGVIDAISTNSQMHWALLTLAVALLCFVLPALLSWGCCLLLRRANWIKENDLKLDLK